MKTVLLTLSFLTFLLVLNPLSSHAVTIHFEQTNLFDSVGQSVNVDVVVSGLGDFEAPSVGAFDLNISFEAAILGFDSSLLGPFLGDIDAGEALDFSLGAASDLTNIAELSLLSESSLDDLQAERFILATLTFDVLMVETSLLGINDPNGGSRMWDTSGDPLGFDVETGRVTPIPEPTTIMLLAGGIAVFGAFGLRRKKIK